MPCSVQRQPCAAVRSIGYSVRFASLRDPQDTHPDRMTTLWIIILGAVGAFVGGGIASFFGVADTAGVDWIRWILSIIAAIIAISVYLSVTGRKNQ